MHIVVCGTSQSSTCRGLTQPCATAKVNIKGSERSVARYPSLKGYVLVITVHYVTQCTKMCPMGTCVAVGTPTTR